MFNQLIPGLSAKSVMGAFIALFLIAAPNLAMAKTFKVNCDKKGNLQRMIDTVSDGDVIEITGICMENILIEDKALTLIGADSPGPHGITGVAEDTDGIRIQHSQGTHIEGLLISNPHFAGVRIVNSSYVTMTDCEVANSSFGEGTGIWVQDMSELQGLRLHLHGNRRGLAAFKQSEAWCRECDINDSTRSAALSWRDSMVTLLDTVVTGGRGMQAFDDSYIDIDCLNHESEHDCSLNVTIYAGLAQDQSQVAFYDSGNFSGWLLAEDRSKIHLFGARQQLNTDRNWISDNSSLRVEPGPSGHSLLSGHTDVQEFSNLLIYGADTILDGTLACHSGGDAWAEGSVILTGFPRDGCMHMP